MKKFSFVLMALAMITSGCSDDGSSDEFNPESNKLVIKGKVSDPAVAGAKIELLDKSGKIISGCGINSNTLCNVWSKSDGSFKFLLPLGTNVSSYTMKTTGGQDSAYGYEFDYALSSSLNYKHNNYVVISPVTSLINEISRLLNGSISQAEEKTAQSLGIDKKDLYLDPESSIKILTMSYILNSIITIDTQDKTISVSDIAKAVSNGAKLTSDQVLNQLISNPSKRQDIKAVITQMNKLVEQGTGVTDAVNRIKADEKYRMFSKSVMNITFQESLSDNAKNNIKYMISTVEKLLGNNSSIPLDQFIIDQLVNYVAMLDNNALSTQAAYDKNTQEFQALFNKAVASEKQFVSEAALLISEKVYNINIPVDNPLGMDNQKRIEYYFTSTQDLNYKARQLTKIVLNDSIRERIYSTIINNYASYGFLDKADKYTGIHIKNTLLRMSKLANITLYASNMYPANKKVRSYVDKAHSDMKEYNKGDHDVTNEYISTYMTFLHSYASIKDTKKVEAVKKEIYDKLNKYPLNGKPSRDTYYARVYNVLGSALKTSLIYQIIDDGNLYEAYQLLKIRQEAVDNAFPPTTQTHNNTQLLAYGHQLDMIIHFYNNDKNKIYGKELSAMVDDIKVKMVSLKDDALKKGQNEKEKYYYVTPFVSLVDALYYVKADRQSAESVYAMYNIPQAGTYEKFVEMQKKNAAVAMFKGKAYSEGFDAGIKYLEKILPLKEDNSNLIDDYLKRIVGMTATAENDGFVYAALRDNKKEDAVKALDYMYKKMALVLKDQQSLNKLPQNVKDKLVSYSLSKGLNVTAKYTTSGVTALAQGYIAAGNSAKAVSVLKLADIYLAGLSDSVAKYDYNMALAYMAKEAGDTALFNKYFNNGIKTGYPLNANDELKAYIHILKSSDAVYLNVENKQTIVKDNLPKAEQLLEDFGKNDATYKAQAEYYTLIAQLYYNVNMVNKSKDMLIKAEKVSASINNPGYQKDIYERIIKSYGYCELIDEGYEKALSLTKDETNRNKLISILVSMVAEKTDFKNTDIATVDTDKDGKPDFFYPWVTEEDKIKHKLELDDDIEGDGINDNEDTLPYVKNK